MSTINIKITPWKNGHWFVKMERKHVKIVMDEKAYDKHILSFDYPELNPFHNIGNLPDGLHQV